MSEILNRREQDQLIWAVLRDVGKALLKHEFMGAEIHFGLDENTMIDAVMETEETWVAGPGGKGLVRGSRTSWIFTVTAKTSGGVMVETSEAAE